MAEYSEAQKSFVFSMVSGGAANQEGSPSDLAKLVVDKFNTVTSTYPQFLGSPWSLVWGPVVYQDPGSKVADNTVFVAKGPGSGRALYIVAIAGTNPKSMFDRGVDFDVFVQVPFGNDPKVLIARGTKKDIDIIAGLTSNGKTLQQFLEFIPDKGAALVFSGHSLGGSLAPTLLLDFIVNRKFGLVRASRFFVYPTAGPTPGNDAFAALYASHFPPAGDFNANVVNSLDVVPHGWAAVEAIKRIYLLHFLRALCIDFLVDALLRELSKGGVSYADLQRKTFSGTFDPKQVPVKFPKSKPVRFAVQALHQHINAYIQQLTPELRTALEISPLDEKAEKGIEDACTGKTGPTTE